MRTRLIQVLVLVVAVALVPISAQGPSPAQIQAALRAFLLQAHTWTMQQDFNGGATCTGTCTGFGSPSDATYITQIPNASLTNEQALSALATGLMKVTTTTGVVTSVTTSAGVSALISDETGSGSMVFGTNPTVKGTLTLADAAGTADGTITGFLGAGGTVTIGSQLIATNGASFGTGSVRIDNILSGGSVFQADLIIASQGDQLFLKANTTDVAVTITNKVTQFGGAEVGAVATLTDGATPALNAALGNTFILVAAGDRTIAVPTNPVSGQTITIQHTASGGARTLALNTGAGGFRFGTDITALTATGSGLTDYIAAKYNATATKWDVVAVVKGF